MKIPHNEKFLPKKRDALQDKLKKICDCDDFVCAVFAYLNSDDDIDLLINFINEHPLSDSSTILIFLLLLKKQRKQL